MMDDNKIMEMLAQLLQGQTELKMEIQGVRAELKEDIQDVKDSLVRMENKFDKQISALHDFRISQDKANQDNVDTHITFATKIEELQLEARITDGKLDEIAEDVNYLAKKSFRHENKLSKLEAKG